MTDNKIIIKEAQAIIKKLTGQYGMTRAMIAGKLGLTEISILYYEQGAHKPKFLAMEKLRHILRGYESRKKKMRGA